MIGKAIEQKLLLLADLKLKCRVENPEEGVLQTARSPIIDHSEATGKTKEVVDAVQAKLKIIPNVVKVISNSPAVLEGYLSFSSALDGGALDGTVREQVALVVGELNECQSCLSGHTVTGKVVGLSKSEIACGRHGTNANAKNAAVVLASEIVVKRGIVANGALDAAQGRGLFDGEIAEVIAHVALNVFPKHFDNVAGVDGDFPRALDQFTKT